MFASIPSTFSDNQVIPLHHDIKLPSEKDCLRLRKCRQQTTTYASRAWKAPHGTRRSTWLSPSTLLRTRIGEKVLMMDVCEIGMATDLVWMKALPLPPPPPGLVAPRNGRWLACKTRHSARNSASFTFSSRNRVDKFASQPKPSAFSENVLRE